MQWNFQSNVTDVLSLGPRTAGLLATVGIRTVVDLIAAKPHVTTARLRDNSISADIIQQWQREAQLRIALPDLPPVACRLFAAVGFDYLEKIVQTTPTEFFAAIEIEKQHRPDGWLTQIALPSVSEVSDWILAAQRQKKLLQKNSRAA